ncbi:bifunctional metallophosphatase/5'-nucleotidase [Agrococcus jejuensis]|uniref:bifunctional metallophosphatase/5'-nucleotidase n=1 Tax=Agrococcus jejuensis TaxID=399736 RepID=UPI0011A2997E|nr:bifunctional UDP-sugar hydrolase/5'-nucleotidase [Agrococcus jejuensis]
MTRSNVRRGALSAVAAAGAIALGLGVAAPASATVNPDGSVTVDLLSITDFHGALRAAPNMAQQIATFRLDNPDTLFSSVGDSIGGSTFESAIFQDEPTIDALNAMALDVSAVGNHEFDQGFDDLVDRVVPLADFPYLAANVEGQSDLAPTEIITTDNGVRVAYIGTVTQQTPDIVSASGVEGLTFTDPVAVTNAIAADIVATDSADVIVALAHEGTAVMRDGLSADVDVVFTGHSHETIPTQVPPPSGVTPLPVSYTPSGAPIVQSGSSGSVLGHVELLVALDGTVTVATAENLSVSSISQAQADSDDPITSPATEPAVLQIVRDTFDAARPIGAQIVGEDMTLPFLAASNSGTPNSGTPQHRGAESPLGNLIAEVARVTANEGGLDADFGIINPGGIRADLVPNASGEITLRQAFNVTSFSNTIGTLDLTGAQVDELLEQQFIGQGSRPMLALGLAGLGYYYDPTAPIGDRVTGIWLETTEVIDGEELVLQEPIFEEDVYTVASNVFLLEGQDGFTVLRDGANPQALTTIDWQATADYLTANPGLLPDYTQQSIGVTEVTPFDQVFEPGDEITIDFSSLSFTNIEPKPSVVTASVVDFGSAPTGDVVTGSVTGGFDQAAAEPGTVLVEAPVDNANVLDSNETGRASVTFTIPEDTEDGLFAAQYVSSGSGLDDQLLGILVVEVDAADAPPSVDPSTPPSATPPTTSPSTPPAAGGAGGTLPQTGAELAGPAVALAALLLMAGIGLVLRRRRTL